MVIIFISLLALVTYFFTSGGNTPYNHFTLLADALLKGKPYIEGIYPWIEKVPLTDTKFFIVNPPMPAILAMPFVYVFGKEFPQQYLTHILGAGIVCLAMLISQKIKKDIVQATWIGLTVGFGSIIWFLASTGSVWYFGQISSTFFLLLAIYTALKSKKVWIVGLCLGAAYLSRSHTILSLPFFIYLLKDKFLQNKKMFFLFLLSMIPFALFDFSYNFSRYGIPFNKGYFLIPGTSNEPWFSKGIMHPSYILEDLKVAFLAMPKLLPEIPYIQPSWAGLAIWITTPQFIFTLFAKFKERAVQIAWFCSGLIFTIVGIHGGTGFAQFGYRFAVDFYPFLIFLLIKGVSSRKIGPLHWLLLFLSIIVNLWGVLWINKFGWISY